MRLAYIVRQNAGAAMPGSILTTDGAISAPAHFAPGHDCTAATALGRQVSGWIPLAGAKDPKLANGYWCHGRTLGTHMRYGYSLFGDSVMTVLEDEYDAIEGGLKSSKADAGTLVLFVKAGSVAHTCLIINIGGRTTTSVHAWTKDGAAPDRVCLLSQVIEQYPHCRISYWRERPSAAKPTGSSSSSSSGSSSSSSSSSGSSHGAGSTDGKGH